MPEPRRIKKLPAKNQHPSPGRTNMSSGFFIAQKELGARIRDVRERKVWIQRDLAKAAGLPVRTIGRIERGEVDVRLSTLSRIAKALGASLKDLLP